MKTRFIIWLIVFAFVLFIAAPPEAAAQTKKDILITAGGVGGMFYVAAAAISEAMSTRMPDIKTTIVPGGAHANPLRIQAGEADMGITYFVNAKCAAEGMDPYNKRLDKVQTVANLSIYSPFSFLVVKDMGIKSFPEIKEKKPPIVLCPGTRGMGGELATRRVLAEYGLSYEEIMKWKGKIHFSGWTEANDLIRDGHAHALSTITAIGSSHLIELVQSRDMVFLPLDEKVRDSMVKLGHIKWVLKAGTYKGLTEDLPTIADGMLLISSSEMPEDLIYKITKIVCENKAQFVTVHKMFETFDPKAAPQDTQMPLHPGALRYYKEIGYLK